MSLPEVKSVKESINSYYQTARTLGAKASNVPENTFNIFPEVFTKAGIPFVRTLTEGGQQPKFYGPYVVNASFCIELMLKLIILLEKKEWISGHKLASLYAQISTSNKKAINDMFKCLHKNDKSRKALEKEVKGLVKRNISWNMVSVLHHSQDAFISWRYQFEGLKKNTCFTRFGLVYSCLDYVIGELLQKNK